MNRRSETQQLDYYKKQLEEAQIAMERMSAQVAEAEQCAQQAQDELHLAKDRAELRSSERSPTKIASRNSASPGR